ncbi:hypothetical protein FQA39_LY11328 [Lamprigera yunnana]|nr:hypothetical protein FQA39_LY11328 [Lamprigera yunnana]
MKYVIIASLVAIVAAAPQFGAQFDPYHAHPYAAYNRQVNPNYYNPSNVYNPYSRNAGYYQHPQQHYYPHAPAVPAVAETREFRPDGSYQFSYATADGQQVQAEGFLKAAAPGVETPVVHGSYSYTAPDGTPVSVNYVADEFGFRAQGPQIPNAEAIEKSIALNIQSEKFHQGPVPVGPIVAPIHK